MFCRAHRFAIVAILTVAPTAASAQMMWQPAAPPSVTAENTSWFIARDPVVWNGALYYPVGTPRALNRYQMVRSGSYRGIPLYTDPMLEANSTVFVPLAGERVQPYERPGSGMIAGTEGRTSLPLTDIDAFGNPGVAQAPAGPAMALPYDPALVVSPAMAPIASIAPIAAPVTTVTSAPMMVDTRRSAAPVAVGTSGRSAAVTPASPVTTVVPPTGANGIWIEYDGRRWFAAGQSIAYEASLLNEVGTYRGWTVYSPKNDPSIIYIPSTPGRLVAYKRR
jgi:hypothetical protein